MTPLSVRTWALGVLALGAVAFATPSARAQYYGLNNSYYYNPVYPVPYNFYSYQYLSVSGVNSNGPYSITKYAYSNSPVPIYNSYPNYGYAPPSSGAMSGGYGSSHYDFSVNPLIEKQRIALKSAQNNAKWNTPADSGARTDFDNWLSEQSTRREANNPAQPAIDIALINPSDEQLLSGMSLNDLTAKIVALEAKGKKAAPGLCPPELVEKINFAGGPAADALNRFHAAKFDAPEVLKLPDFNMLLEAFEKAYLPLAAVVQSGKKAAPADIDRLLAVLDKAKPMTEPTLKNVPIQDAKSLLVFYAGLESAAKYLKLPESVGVLGSKWNSVGVNVSDLVKHLQKYQIRIGRAAAGNDAAYGSLHRGMLAYYAALSQAK